MAFAAGSTALTNALYALASAFIAESRPPIAFHSFSISRRALDMFPIRSPRVLLTAVHSFFASSKLPIITSQLSAHPVPNASLRVSINCLNVFTSVAAAFNVGSSANLFNVFNKTSDVSQFGSLLVSSLREFRKDMSPSSKPSGSVFPISLAVSIKPFWKYSPPMPPAFSIDFQSISLTTPLLKA